MVQIPEMPNAGRKWLVVLKVTRRFRIDIRQQPESVSCPELKVLSKLEKWSGADRRLEVAKRSWLNALIVRDPFVAASEKQGGLGRKVKIA